MSFGPELQTRALNTSLMTESLSPHIPNISLWSVLTGWKTSTLQDMPTYDSRIAVIDHTFMRYWAIRCTMIKINDFNECTHASNALSASLPLRWSRSDTETKPKKRYEWQRSEQAGRKQEEAVRLCSRRGMRKRSCSVSNCSEGGQGTFSQRGKVRRRPSTYTSAA